MISIGELGPTESWGYPLNSWEPWQGNPIPLLPASLSFPEYSPAPFHTCILEPLRAWQLLI